MGSRNKFNTRPGGNVLHPTLDGDSVHVIYHENYKEFSFNFTASAFWSVNLYRTIDRRNDVGNVNKAVNGFRPEAGISRADQSAP